MKVTLKKRSVLRTIDIVGYALLQRGRFYGGVDRFAEEERK